VIRTATETDKVRVITLLKHSREGAGFDSANGLTGFTFPFDAAYAERLFIVHQMPRHLCLLHVVEDLAQGVLMAAYAEHPFGPVRLARETVWWIEPEYRGLGAVKMLDAYEHWARANHCQFIGMAGMGDDPDVGKLYRRRGYQVAERHYLKAI
jgi:hypothetical protein